MFMAAIGTILIPTRPQPDTIVAIFLLKKFGQERFPAIDEARVEVQAQLTDTFDALLAQGTLALDLGGSVLDHHGKDICTSELVAKYLNIEKDPSIQQLVAYARRDDKQGKGTLSRDALDRAFGLSGLIAALNKSHPTNPNLVVDAALPLLDAHWHSAYEHHVELPLDVEHKRSVGEYMEDTVRQGTKTLKFVSIVSDKPSMPTFLRSERGGRADVVLQRTTKTGHSCVLSRQDRDIDLSKVAGLIRLREAELSGIELPDDDTYATKTGRIDEVSHWYYDPATNSLLNGGPHSPEVTPSRIGWDELKQLVTAGLELGSSVAKPATRTNPSGASYYLSINIPSEIARRFTERIDAPKDVKIHDPRNLHVTLHHFGQQSHADAATFAAQIAEAFSDVHAFDLTLHDGLLRTGSPEGYSDTSAWYLEVGGDDARTIHTLREKVLAAVGLPWRGKELHVTLAANRDRGTQTAPEAVRFGEPVETTIPVGEVVLMESAQEGGKRVYRTYRTFTLKP